tara:strand:- start:473 stop:940 length:468 start_codon:yes stop_codon:yes gene_type:complete
MNKEKIINSLVAGIFSTLTIGCLTLLTYKTQFGLFLIASFGSTMVLLYGYPESPFAQPKNIFFGHILTAFIGVIFVNYIPLPLYLSIPISVGLGVFSMIFFNVTHPPAGGNPIIVLMGSASFGYLLYPVIIGVLIVILFGIILNRFILKKTYPKT